MNKSVFFTAILLAGAAFATTSTQTGANVYGVLRVDSTNAETIVAIPWVGVGTTASDINVAEIIKTAGLNNGDSLYAYIDGGFKKWVLTDGEWTPSATVSGDGPAAVSAGASDQTLTRGKAVLLVRQGTIADYFFVQGQVASSSTADLAITAGTSVSPAYTLIAPPVDSDISDLNSNITYVGDARPNADDIIYVSAGVAGGLMRSYVYKNSKWGYYQRSANFWEGDTFVETLTIPAGQGAWYVSKGGAPTIRWTGLPSTSNQ